MTSLEKTYHAYDLESIQYQRWLDSGLLSADHRSSAQPFTIMMPPPNVTGILHIGHGLNMCLQDILIRYYRMKGYDTLWQPGTDHAGIATQMVVEQQLAKQGLNRTELGRQEFVKRIWAFKQWSGKNITQQLRSLGVLPDWTRERFTLDKDMNRAVIRVFVQLYREGLIYKDKRLVNWDPKLQTAISDLEVKLEEREGHLWYIRYPLIESQGWIVVATTRPETLFGDTALAVHPADTRYSPYIGHKVLLPLVGRTIPILADEMVDPQIGSGALKITPAHDAHDFIIGQRHDLERINIFDHHAHLNDNVPEAYRGLDRFVAREHIVQDLQHQNLLEKVEKHSYRVPYGDRSGVPY